MSLSCGYYVSIPLLPGRSMTHWLRFRMFSAASCSSSWLASRQDHRDLAARLGLHNMTTTQLPQASRKATSATNQKPAKPIFRVETVDGRTPVDTVANCSLSVYPILYGLQPSKMVQDFFHPPYHPFSHHHLWRPGQPSLGVQGWFAVPSIIHVGSLRVQVCLGYGRRYDEICRDIWMFHIMTYHQLSSYIYHISSMISDHQLYVISYIINYHKMSCHILTQRSGKMVPRIATWLLSTGTALAPCLRNSEACTQNAERHGRGNGQPTLLVSHDCSSNSLIKSRSPADIMGDYLIWYTMIYPSFAWK